MNNFQEKYEIELHTLSPLHIASGKEINKKEYILDTKSNTARIINSDKLLEFVSGKDLFDSFKNFMCSDTLDDLGDWLKQVGAQKNEIDELIDYTIDCRNTDTGIFMNNRGIKTFIKDAYNQPYIPGSSLKGCLRTVLLAYDIKNRPGDYSHIANIIARQKLRDKRDKDDLNYKSKALEQTAFYKAGRKTGTEKDRRNAINDVMQGIIISDSQPVSCDKLTLCQKRDLKTNGMYSELPIFNECIIPGVTIRFSMTIDSSFCNITIEQIEKAVAQFARDYYKNYISVFGQTELTCPNTIWLGGNVGFQSKTVINNLFQKPESVRITSNILSAIGHFGKNSNDSSIGISPHTIHMALYGDSEYRMGECRFTAK